MPAARATPAYLASTLALAGDILTLSARRKVLWVFLALSTTFVLVVIGGLGVEVGDGKCEVLIVGQQVFVADDTRAPEIVLRGVLTTWLHNAILWWVAGVVGVFLGLIATIDAVSSAFEPGAVELILPRAVSRSQVVLARLLGAVLFAAVQVGWITLLAVLLAGIKFGVWLPAMLIAVPVLLAKFLLLAVIATAVVVVTRVHTLGVAAVMGVWITSWAINGVQPGVVDPTRNIDVAAVWAQRLCPQVAYHAEWVQEVVGIPVTGVASFDWRIVALQDVVWIALPLALVLFVVSRRDY